MSNKSQQLIIKIFIWQVNRCFCLFVLYFELYHASRRIRLPTDLSFVCCLLVFKKLLILF